MGFSQFNKDYIIKKGLLFNWHKYIFLGFTRVAIIAYLFFCPLLEA